MVRRPTSNTYYYVTQLKDHEGAVTFEVLTYKDLKCRLKELSDDHKEGLKEWYALRKDAVKAGESFEDRKPTKPKRKYVKIKGKVNADALLAKLEAKWEAIQAKKEAKSLGDGDFKDDETPKENGDNKKASREKPKARG